jgi:hypothetical protein
MQPGTHNSIMGRGADVKTNYRKLMVLASIVLALSGAVLAQDFTPKVRATIPFNFYVGNTMLPSGTYTISVNSQSHTVSIRTRSGVGSFLFANQIEASPNGNSFLIFRTDGQGTYALQKIEGPEFGLGVPVEKVLSHLALDTHSDETRVMAASLGK